jgi:hypothetical protein
MPRTLRVPAMIIRSFVTLMIALPIAGCGRGEANLGAPKATAAKFDGAQRMKFPADYREWVFLSSGHGMSYSPAAGAAAAPYPPH